MSYYFRQKQVRPQTTSNTRQLDNSALRESKLVSQSHQLCKQFTTPKMHKDREILYEENIKLKGQMNELVSELIQQKSRVSQLEKELQRFENLIEDSIKPDCSHHKLERHGLVLKMKTRQKEILLDLQSKNKELSELKRSLRYTNYQELEVELKTYIDETIRLRQQLDYNQQMIALQTSGQSLEKKVMHLEKTLKILQRDNQELAEKQQNNDQIQLSLQIKLEETQKQNERYLSDIVKYEQTIKELTEYNKQCNDLITQLQQSHKVQVQNQQNNKSDELQKTQILLETAQTKHQQELDAKSSEIRQLKTEIQRLKLEAEQMEKIIESQEDKIRELESCAYSPISKVGQIDSPLQNGFKIMQIEMKTNLKKKLPKVQYTDIRYVCMRMKLNLVTNKVPSSEVEKYFSEYEEMSIHQIKNVLHRPPFEIQDHESIKLLARYLVEDNSEDYVIYDQEKSNSTAVIKSVLKKVIGKYEIYTPEEEQVIMKSLKQKLNPSIMETIQMMTAKTQNPLVCEQSHFDQALKFHEIQLTQREVDKLNFLIFDVSNSVDIINYQKLFAYFT